MIEAVLFDLGDTLISYRNVDLRRAFIEGARDTYQFIQDKVGPLPVDFKRYKWSQLVAIRWAYIKSKITGREFNSTELLRRYIKRLKIDLPEEYLDELAWQWYRPLADQAQIEQDAHKTLEHLKDAGLKLAIVSNTFVAGKSLDRHLQNLGLIEFFPIRIYSCDIGVRKPNIRLFKTALERLNIPAQKAIFVGDSYSADIKGARKAGLYAIYKANTPHTKIREDSKVFVISRLKEIPSIIEKINAEKTG